MNSLYANKRRFINKSDNAALLLNLYSYSYNIYRVKLMGNHYSILRQNMIYSFLSHYCTSAMYETNQTCKKYILILSKIELNLIYCC